MDKEKLLREFIEEIFGILLPILLGDGSVANVGLRPRLASAAHNWNTIAWGWGFAVFLAVYVSAGVSDAYISSAVTFGLTVRGTPLGAR